MLVKNELRWDCFEWSVLALDLLVCQTPMSHSYVNPGTMPETRDEHGR
jgi:hypothetical protein